MKKSFFKAPPTPPRRPNLSAAPVFDRRGSSQWVPRPPFSVGYNMPVPQRRGATPWSYTLPTHVRGAFMRALSGVLLRKGGSRPC